MPSSFLPILIALAAVVLLGAVVRLIAQWTLERRAWGDSRSRLSRADRREIRRSSRTGGPVGTPRLAEPAIRYQETLLARLTRAKRADDNSQAQAFMRVLLPLVGVIAIILGLLGAGTWHFIAGAVLLGMAALRLTPAERRISAREERRLQRLRAAMNANQPLSPGP
ncbi:hypothetical protein [Actinomadura sp. 21ATH]|uniref:hypothetical protein n=1 Tax=Actinomadura sp. 21ATH TaxID=1735444 RepID=UPI0035C11888